MMIPHFFPFDAHQFAHPSVSPATISPSAAMTPSLSMQVSSVLPQAMPTLAAALPQVLTHRPPGPRDWSPRGRHGIIPERI